MNQDKQYILFYSNKCQHSNHLLSILNNANHIKSQVYFFCIDDNYNNIPKGITSVPTLLLKENNNIIVGKSIFQWLSNKLNNNQPQQQSNNNNQQFNNNNQNIQQQQTINNGGEPMAWHGAEMGNAFSDNYSFLDSDVSVEGMGGNSIAHSFSFLNENNTNYRPPNNQIGGNIEKPQMSNNEKDKLSQSMERMMAQRDQEIQAPIQRF